MGWKRGGDRMFHYGGSSWCLVLGRGVGTEWCERGVYTKGDVLWFNS